MAKQSTPRRQTKNTARPKSKRRTATRPATAPPRPPFWRTAMILGIEATVLLAAALVATITVLGRSAAWFGGSAFTSSLLPFAATVLASGLLCTWSMGIWMRSRTWLKDRGMILPAVLSLMLGMGTGWFALQDEFHRELANFRTLLGGRDEAAREALAHQVFASYRRSRLSHVESMMARAKAYEPVIREAAETYGVDPEVLVGIAAAESSFRPRDSRDGGRGLFQITAPPKSAVKSVQNHLAVDRLDLRNHRHNALVAAATLSHYLVEMGGDLFLGLLAYNIGPKNGGLRSIMRQYGARDFVTIQPYLQDLPRDYPVRVLTAALAYRLWREEGSLPRYEKGSNAMRIQKLGIPGL